MNERRQYAPKRAVSGIRIRHYRIEDRPFVVHCLVESQQYISSIDNFSLCILRKLFGNDVTFVGNPSTIDIEGRKVLSYHGRSFDDIISSIPGLTWEKPIETMVELLKRRHLAPVYGEKTPLAPEHKDYLVIDEVPDIFVTGHIHSYGLSDYRGVKLISGSTWQSQTSYQKMKNITPIPAKMPVIELSSLNMGVVNFSDFHRAERRMESGQEIRSSG